MGDFPSPVRHRCDVYGVLSLAMPLRYDRLCRITSRKSICVQAYTSEKQRGLEDEKSRGREKEKETEILFLYVDRGGCPVFRVTWLNWIALAHSCPLRRDGRLASRIFLFLPPLPFPAPLLYTRPSQSHLARASLANAREKRSVSFFVVVGRGSKTERGSSRNNARSNAVSLQWGKTRWLFALDGSWIRDCDCQHSRFVLNFTLISRSFEETLQFWNVLYVSNRHGYKSMALNLDDVLKDLDCTLKIKKFQFWLLDMDI